MAENGYVLFAIDDSEPAYYGYTDADGNWEIIKITESTKTRRFTKGTTDKTTNWTNRAGLTYDYYNEVF